MTDSTRLDQPARKALSPHRNLVLDGLSHARQVPLFPVERQFDLGELAQLRASLPRRISWTALFLKAYASVCADIPALRQSYQRWPWAHVHQSPDSVAMVCVNRRVGEEDRLCWARFVNPQTQPLATIQRELEDYQFKPVEQMFRKQLRLSKLPTPVRKLLWWWNLNVSVKKRAMRVGTFTVSSLAGQGVLNRHHPTSLTTSLTYGPVNEDGSCLVTLLCDHRVLDGTPAARALNRLEEVLRGQIAHEVAAMSVGRVAA